jgi:hypothetical protein
MLRGRHACGLAMAVDIVRKWRRSLPRAAPERAAAAAGVRCGGAVRGPRLDEAVADAAGVRPYPVVVFTHRRRLQLIMGSGSLPGHVARLINHKTERHEGERSMARTVAGRAIPVLLLAALALAGCDNSAPSSPATSSNSTAALSSAAASPTAVPPPVAIATPAPSAVRQCRRLYETWQHGTAASTFQADLNYILSKQGAVNVSRMTSVLERAGSVAPTVPLPPQCADPAGYYLQLLAGIKTASHNARTASGLGHLLMAEAPLRGLTVIKGYLSAELAITVGKKS